MNTCTFATAPPVGPWVLPPSDRVSYIAQLTKAIAFGRWSLAYHIADVLSAGNGQDYVAAIERLKSKRAHAT